MRARAMLLALVLALVGTPAFAAWWDLVHCTGSDTHGGGNPPQNEEASGFQCHGQPGDAGPCDGSDQQSTFSVSCSTIVRPNGTTGGSLCFASVMCPAGAGGDTWGCGGINFEVFAGTTVDGGDGRRTGFAECRKPGGDVERFQCPHGTAISS